MGSIVLDEIKVKNNVIPNLSRTKTIMQDAYSTCNTLKNSLPSSFSSRSMVSSIATKIASSEKKVTDVYNNLNYKMDYVKRIESKTESKVSSLASTASKIGTSLGMITGAVVGSAGGVVGTAVGAATGAVVGKATGEVVGKIVETGAKVAKTVVSGVKNVVVGVFNFFKDTGAKIAEGVKSIWEKAAGKVKEIATKTTEVVKTTFNKIKDTGAKVVKGVTSTVKKVVTTTKDLAVKAGTSIVKGAKSVWNFISSTAKKVGNTVKDVTTKTIKAVKNTGAKIVNGVTSTCKKLWNGAVDLGKSFINGCKNVFKSVKTWVDDKFLPGVKELAKKIGDAVVTGLKWTGNKLLKIGASVVNTAVSIVEGVVGFAESLVDVVILAGGVVLSVPTFLSDLIEGAIEGNLSFSATKTLWTKGIMPAVGFDATNKMFDALYNTKVMKAIDDKAAKPFKRGGIAYEIGEGVGYVTGIILMTLATAGIGTAATTTANAASATTQATTAVTTQVAKKGVLKFMTNKVATSTLYAGLAKTGESTQGNYNSLTEEEKNDFGKIMGVLGTGVLDGAVESATWYLTYSGGAAALKGSDKKLLAKLGAVFDGPDKIKIPAKALLQAGKAYVKEGNTVLIDGDFDGKKAFESALVNASVSVLYDTTASKWVKIGAKNREVQPELANKTSNMEAALEIMNDAGDDAADKAKEVVSLSFREKYPTILGKLFGSTQTAGGKKIFGTTIKDPLKEIGNFIADKLED